MSVELNFEIVVVYFIYGLAFFSMGLAIMLEARRSPLLAEARVLAPLAFFGFVHGSHEWLEMALILRSWFGFTDPLFAPVVRLVMLVISFVSLALYGFQVLRPQKSIWTRANLYFILGLLALYSLLVIFTNRLASTPIDEWVKRADILARYILAVPGAAIAALALNRQASQARAAMRRSLSIHLRLAGLGFAVYSLTQCVVAPADILLSPYLNTASFLAWAGFPIQAVRAVMAVLVTFGLIRATQDVEGERQRQFVAAQEARLQALEQIRNELVEREAMRRELLRHTVAAQEDERARIARELHDETAQFLTALSLDLATMQNSVRRNTEAARILERLQSMSRQISQGIYRMVHDLRPAQLDDLGLVAALGYLVDEARHNQLQVTLTIKGNRQRLDPLIATVLFRIAQEALTNVERHAGVSQAMLVLSFDAQEISLEVQDEGVGFDPAETLRPPHGWGLAGMRERAESVGGHFHIDSTLGHGTLVKVVVPASQGEYSSDINGSLSGQDRDSLTTQQPSHPITEENADEYHTVNAG
jgi:signal transduction histidine kinase